MKRSTIYVWIVLALAATGGGTLQSEEAIPPEMSPRESLRSSAMFFGDPGGMPFHTAFHGGVTTRFLLLKAALQSRILEAYLTIDEKQRSQITELHPVKVELKKQTNEQPDEQVLDPGYFDLLRADQLIGLDVLAIRFDGYSALTRKSLAHHLNLSDPSRSKIEKLISETRERIFLPRFRWEFAAKLPDDIKFQDCYFAGSVCTQLNISIIDSLTDDECQRLVELLAKEFDNEAIAAVVKLSPMPKGIQELRRFIEAKK